MLEVEWQTNHMAWVPREKKTWVIWDKNVPLGTQGVNASPYANTAMQWIENKGKY